MGGGGKWDDKGEKRMRAKRHGDWLLQIFIREQTFVQTKSKLNEPALNECRIFVDKFTHLCCEWLTISSSSSSFFSFH